MCTQKSYNIKLSQTGRKQAREEGLLWKKLLFNPMLVFSVVMKRKIFCAVI